MRQLILIALFVACDAACAQAPGPSPMSAQDLQIVYRELAQTHDGFVYTVHMAGYSSEDEARKTWEEVQQPRMRMLRMDQIFRNAASRTGYLFAFDPPIREKLVTLYRGARAGPIRTPRNWVIIELVDTKRAPMPPLAGMAADIPGLVAAGAVPSAARLRSDPELRKRSLANAVRTLQDLRRAPADLDVNRLLSTGETLLVRSLLKSDNALSEALLKRGADPNACAYKFCPLHLAALRGDRPMAKLLIAKGADVLAVSNGTTVLDAAEQSKNPAFAAWLRGVIRAKQSGQARGK